MHDEGEYRIQQTISNIIYDKHSHRDMEKNHNLGNKSITKQL